MPCPNCGSIDMWDDHLHCGCNKCSWNSLAGLNPTRTPSNPRDADEVRRREADFRSLDREHGRRITNSKRVTIFGGDAKDDN